jgi:alpha-tubulin suppressor-like RCC1 family protein
MKRLVLGVCASLSLTAGCHTIMGYEDTEETAGGVGGMHQDAGIDADASGGGGTGGVGGTGGTGGAGGSGGVTGDAAVDADASGGSAGIGDGGIDASTGGAAGSAGQGGLGGAAGSTGSSGGGMGGSSGSAGVGGSSGAAGVGGAAGTAGVSGSGVVEIARISYGATCARLSNGQVRCWGSDSYRGVRPDLSGNERIGAYWEAISVPEVVDAVHIAGGGYHFCAVTGTERNVKCWGLNQDSQLGTVGSYPGVVDVPNLNDVVELALGGNTSTGFSCARRTDGTVWCWGHASKGSLGDGTTVDRAIPEQVPGLLGVVQISAALDDSLVCARMSSGPVLCWGLDVPYPSAVPSSDDATRIEAGDGNELYVLDGIGIAWKHEFVGGSWSQPTIVDQNYPELVQISGGWAFGGLCGVRSDGSATCGLYGASFLQVELAGGALPAVCGLTTAGTVLCRGGNKSGDLGNGKPLCVRTPVQVQGLAGVEDVFPAAYSTAAVLSDGSVATWGKQFALANSFVPESQVSLGTGNTFVRFGCLHPPYRDDCAYVGSPSGLSYYDASGGPVVNTRLGASTGAPFQAAYPPGSNTGNLFDIGAKDDGAVVVYAASADANTYGIFGDGTTASSSGDLVTISAVSGVTGFAGRNYDADHACVWLGDGTAKCWGRNQYGQVGTGDTTTATTPQQVLFFGTGVNVERMAVGVAHTCAVAQDGRVLCWGRNYSGQLGSGDNTDYHRGYPVAGINSATDVACGNSHTCVLLEDKTVRCWGSNEYGQVGDGSYDLARNSPGPDIGLSDVEQIRAGGDYMCAVHTDRTVSCWGNGLVGQVGVNLDYYDEPQVVVGLVA